MRIRFTKHAEQKFDVLRAHGVRITQALVISVLRNPDYVDRTSRFPLCIAQGHFDARRVLRIVHKVEGDTIVIITFYPGRKSHYERQKQGQSALRLRRRRSKY